MSDIGIVGTIRIAKRSTTETQGKVNTYYTENTLWNKLQSVIYNHILIYGYVTDE